LICSSSLPPFPREISGTRSPSLIRRLFLPQVRRYNTRARSFSPPFCWSSRTFTRTTLFFFFFPPPFVFQPASRPTIAAAIEVPFLHPLFPLCLSSPSSVRVGLSCFLHSCTHCDFNPSSRAVPGFFGCSRSASFSFLGPSASGAPLLLLRDFMISALPSLYVIYCRFFFLP